MEIPKVATIQNVPTIVQPTIKPAAVTVPTIANANYLKYEREQREKRALFFDYNDPDQVNSYADVVGRTVKRLLEPNELPIIGNVLSAADQLLTDTASLNYNSFIKPILYGGSDAGKILLLNNANNLFETLDILANPIKGAILGGGINGAYDAFFNRVNYDYDTGNLAADIAAEIVSDPINWVTFGMSALGKAVLKGAAEVGEEVIEEVGAKTYKRLLSTFYKDFAGNTADTISKLRRHVDLTPEAERLLNSITLNKTTMNVIKATKAIGNAGNALDTAITKTAFYSSFGLPAYIAKKGAIDPVRNMMVRQMQNTLTAIGGSEKTPLSLVKYFDNESDILKVATSLDVAADNITNFPTHVKRDVVSTLVLREHRALAEALSYRTSDTFDEAFRNTLDEQVASITDGHFTYFPDYVERITRLAELNNDVPMLDVYANDLAKYKSYYDRSELAPTFTKLREQTRVMKLQYKDFVSNVMQGLSVTILDYKQILESVQRVDPTTLDSKELNTYLRKLKSKADLLDDDELRAIIKKFPSHEQTRYYAARNKLVSSAAKIDKCKVAIAKRFEIALEHIPVGEVRLFNQLDKQFPYLDAKTRKLFASLREAELNNYNAMKELPSEQALFTAKLDEWKRMLRTYAPADRFKVTRNLDEELKLHNNVVWYLSKLEKFYDELYDAMPTRTYTLLDGTIINSSINDFKDKLTLIKEYLSTLTLETLNIDEIPTLLADVEEELNTALDMAYYYLTEQLDNITTHLDFAELTESLHTYIAGANEMTNLLDTSLTRTLSSRLDTLSDLLNEDLSKADELTGLVNDLRKHTSDVNMALYSESVQQALQAIDSAQEVYTTIVKPLFFSPTDLDEFDNLVGYAINKVNKALTDINEAAKVRPNSTIAEVRNTPWTDPLHDEVAWRNKYQAIDSKRTALEKSGLQYKDAELYERKLAQINAESERLYEAQLRFEARAHEKTRAAEVPDPAHILDAALTTLEDIKALYKVDTLRALPQSDDPSNPIVEYTQKLLTLSSYHRLIDNDNMLELINSIENKTEYYDALLILEGLGSEAAYKIRATLEGLGSYVKFVQLLKQSRLPKKVQGALLDTMQNYSWLDKYGMAGVYEVAAHDGRVNHIRSIVNNTADALLSNSSKRNYKLENFSQVIRERHPEWFTRFKGTDLEHTAMYDAYATAMLDRELGLFEHKGKQVRRYYADIESTGFNAHQGAVLQIGLYDAETDELFNFVVGKVPSDIIPPSQDVLDLLYGGSVDMYNAIHYDANEAVANARFGEGSNTIMCATEEEALTKLQMMLKRDQSMLVDNVLTFHNGNQFDVEFINTRLSKYSLPPIAARKIEDTLEAWRAKEGIMYMSTSQKAEAERLLREYIALREMEQVSQDALTRALDQGGIHVHEFSDVADRGRFIPKLDREFTDSLNTVVDELMSAEHRHISPNLAHHLTDIRHNLINTLKGVKETNYAYSRHRIYKNDLAKAFDEVKPGTFDEIEHPAMRADKNIMLYFFDDTDELNPLNPKVTFDEAVLKKWYNLDWTAMYKDGFIQYLTKMGRDMTRVAGDVDLVVKLRELTDISTLRVMRSKYLDLMHEIVPSTKTYELKTLFKESNSIVDEFVMTRAVYNQLVRVVTNDATLSKEYSDRLISHNINDIRYYFANNVKLRASVDRNNEVSQKYWQLNLTDEAANRYLMNAKFEANSIDQLRLRAIEKARLGIATPKSEVQAVMHEQIYNLFIDVQKGTAGLDDSELGAYYIAHKQAFDLLDKEQAYNNIREFLSLSPEQMKARLYHQSNSVVTFKLSDIMLNKYQQDASTGTLVSMYKDFIDNSNMYSALGIDVFEYAERVWVVLKSDAMDKGIRYNAIKTDHAIDYAAIVQQFDKADSFKELMLSRLKQYAAIRKELGATMDDVGYSTLENLDEYAMRTIYDRVPKEVLERLPSLDTLRTHGAFVGAKFNHSILGTAPSRHELMPYSSYNPAKNLHAAIDLVQSRLDDTIKYEAYMDAATHKLDGDLYKGIPDEQLVEYFKESRGAMRLAFKAPSKRAGQQFEIKAIHVNGVADLEFARKVGAVVMTEHMYTKSVSILNQNGLRNPFLKAFEKTIVTPSKVGMLLFKEGFILRNILDSTIKNMVDTGDPIGILQHTLDTGVLYFKYKKANLEMIAMAKEMHLSLREVIPMYFKTERAISRDVYELVHRFKIDGYSGGMTKELVDYYGEATDKLYRMSGIERWGITAEEFKELIHAPKEVALEQLAVRYPNDQYLLSQFKSMQQTYHDYKRAYAMLKHTYNQSFNLENLVVYIQEPNKLPAELVTEFNELMDKTKHVTDQEGLVDQFMELSPVRAFFDINVGLEEIFRLTNYTYHMKYNLLPEHEALSHTLRTHFDYAHKSQWQYYTELLFPFSTFKLNNFMFWWEHFNNNPMALRMVEDLLGEVMALDEYDHDDIAGNRSLQYHILAGNLVLKDSEANLVVKLSPSVVDTLAMLVDPEGTMASSLVAPLKVAYELSTNPKKAYESFEEYDARVANTLTSAIPIVGPVYTGLQGAQKLANATGGAPYSMFSSTLGVVKYPKRKAPNLKRTYGKKLYSSYTRPGAHRNLLKRYRYYHALTNRTLFATGYYSRRHNIQIMTRKGGAIARYLSMPTNKYTNNMKVALLRTRF